MSNEAPAPTAYWPEVDTIAQTLRSLDPGPLATLRRDPTRSPAFWRLRSKLDLRDPDAWPRIVRMMALLTETGRPDGKASPHNGTKPLGEALCDGGASSWGVGVSAPRPMLSEARFARLLHARGDTLAVLLERVIRMLARRKDARQGVDCKALADLLLAIDRNRVRRNLADAYYRRLDRAARSDASNAAQTGADSDPAGEIR